MSINLPARLLGTFLFASIFSSYACTRAKEIFKGGDKKPTTQTSQLGAKIPEKERTDFEKLIQDLLQQRFVSNISNVPTSAELPFKPYTGNFYRLSTNAMINSGALQAYDKAFGTNAVQWERDNHRGDPSKDFMGHCNGLAAASSQLAEPTESVTVNEVTFTPLLIKALLAEIYMSAGGSVIGGIQCLENSASGSPFARTDAQIQTKCEDMNPATLHLSLANFIASAKPIPFIIDTDPKEAVWNYPVYAYRCKNCSDSKWKEVSQEQAIRIIDSSKSRDTAYTPNPAAKKFYDIAVDLIYADGSETEVINQPKEGTKSLRYILEADEAGNIIGGEWSQQNRNDHPDQLWIAYQALKPSGQSSVANAELEPKKVMDLWRISREKSGDLHPYEGLQSPYANTEWAKFPSFSVSIDGAKSPYLYRSGDYRFVFTPHTDAIKIKTLSISLNGNTIQTLSLEKENSHTLKLGPGVNALDFVVENIEGQKSKHSLKVHVSE